MYRTPFHETPRQRISEDEDIQEAQQEAHKKTYERIRNYKGSLDFTANNSSSSLSKETQDVILSLLRPLSNERLTAFELLMSDWITCTTSTV